MCPTLLVTCVTNWLGRCRLDVESMADSPLYLLYKIFGVCVCKLRRHPWCFAVHLTAGRALSVHCELKILSMLYRRWENGGKSCHYWENEEKNREDRIGISTWLICVLVGCMHSMGIRQVLYSTKNDIKIVWNFYVTYKDQTVSYSATHTLLSLILN